MPDDAELLRRYAEDGSQDAFRDLVQRNLKLVFGAALRRTNGDRELALDVSQKVFSAVAGEARELSRHPALAAWLYTATRNETIKAVLSETRRRHRERAAADLNADMNAEPAFDWDRLRPILDDAMDELPSADRDALVVRYFDDQPLSAVATALGISDDAARKRVDRALEKLRARFTRAGVNCTAAALAELLACPPAIVGHATLASAISGSVLAGAAGGSALGSAAAATIMTPAKAALVAAGLVATFGALNIAAYRERSSLTEAFRADEAVSRASLRAATNENARLREAVASAGKSASLVVSDEARLTEMGDLISGGLLGVNVWPSTGPNPLQHDSLAGAITLVAGVIGLNETQTTALQEVIRSGRAAIGAAILANAEISRTDDQVGIVIGENGIRGARQSFEAMLREIERTITPEKATLLRECGFIAAVQTALGSLGIRATEVTIKKQDRVINGRPVGGYSYAGQYRGTHEALINPANPNGTFSSNDRGGLSRTLGEIAYRLPNDF